MQETISHSEGRVCMSPFSHSLESRDLTYPWALGIAVGASPNHLIFLQSQQQKNPPCPSHNKYLYYPQAPNSLLSAKYVSPLPSFLSLATHPQDS